MIFQDLVFPLVFSAILVLFQTVSSALYFRTTDTCVCGLNNELAPRIVGGVETLAHKYPWTAVILRNGNFHCGASLINDQYVMTAGHCFAKIKLKDLSLVLGSHKVKDWSTSEKKQLESFVVHEDFTSDVMHDINDIALIKLGKPVKFSSTIRPVCLPNAGKSYVGKNAIISGWGRMGESGEAAPALRETNVTVMTNEECQKAPVVGNHITPNMLCAYKPNSDACQGDSGGPLILQENSGRFDQIGIVSWGIGCARKDIPGIYTRITDYLEWISLHTTDATYCRLP